MRQNPDYQKLRGGYYTPASVSEFIVKWGLTSSTHYILEPSCGDGSFLRAIKGQLDDCDAGEKNVYAVELDPAESQKASLFGFEVVNSDFFEVSARLTTDHAVDLVVGNPPFIRYQNFDEESRALAFDQLRVAGFNPTKLTNIWVPFLLLSALSLSEDGRLGMVIPAELLQVNYAQECREFLAKYFSKVTIVSFRQLLFEGAQQEVVLVLAEKSPARSLGICFVELNDASDLRSFSPDSIPAAEYSHPGADGKWTRFYVTASERELLDKVSSSERVVPTVKLFDTNVGVVSGENKFFVIDDATVKQWGLEKHVSPIVSKTDNLKGLSFDDRDFCDLVESGKKVFLLELNDSSQLDGNVAKYIQYGVEQGYCENYKCRIRTNWYCVPISWRPNGFALRQVGKFPRIIVNKTIATSTDTVHKVRFHEDVDAEVVAAAFINSYTFALSETIGRSYGGGVLTFEPSEIRLLRIPLANTDSIDFAKIDALLREGRIEEALDLNDKVLLCDGLGLSWEEVLALRSAWKKLSGRRLNRRSK